MRYTSEVALEAIRGDLTLAELAARHGIHPTMIATWKHQATEGMAATFSGASEASKTAGDTEIEKLHAKIGQLVVERDFVEEVHAMSVERRRRMIERGHANLSIVAQCRLVSISRSSCCYAPVAETAETLALMTVIDASFLDHPWYGSRQMARPVSRLGHAVGRRRVRRRMAKMGLSPIYQRPRTGDPHPEHRIYPYLLRDLRSRGRYPSLVRRHHLHPDAARLPLPGGDYRLGIAQGAGLAAVEHDGRGVLRRRPERGVGAVRQARHPQHRPREPVQQQRLH